MYTTIIKILLLRTTCTAIATGIVSGRLDRHVACRRGPVSGTRCDSFAEPDTALLPLHPHAAVVGRLKGVVRQLHWYKTSGKPRPLESALRPAEEGSGWAWMRLLKELRAETHSQKLLLLHSFAAMLGWWPEPPGMHFAVSLESAGHTAVAVCSVLAEHLEHSRQQYCPAVAVWSHRDPVHWAGSPGETVVVVVSVVVVLVAELRGGTVRWCLLERTGET